MTIHTTVTSVGGTTVVSVDGVLDLASVAQLHSDLANVVRRHPGAVLMVDLDATSAIDDTALGVLLGAAASARAGGGDLQVVCTRDAVRDRLRRTRFDRAVDVRASITPSTRPTDARDMSTDDPIFHLALPEDWAGAFETGEYRMSTRGMTLDEVGYIHCSTGNQMVDTANRFYADLEELVILTIDPHLVPSPIVHEPPSPGSDLLFPHIYGPLPIVAVHQTRFWRRRPADSWRADSM